MTVHVVATGGTISSHFTPKADGGGEWSNLTGRQLLDEQGFTDVVVHDVASGPSSICCTYHAAEVGESPANTTSGMLPRAAVVSAVMICVKPGPQVTVATPTLPVWRA